MVSRPYPLFAPSDTLAAKSQYDWSMQEAKWYFNWLMGCLSHRIAALLEHFGFDRHSSSPRDLLLRLGERVAEQLTTDQFSEPGPDGTRVLTNAGYALAADMGLLTAQVLIEQNAGKVRWEILRKPKRAASYNFPVLVGFGRPWLDPIRGSIAEARSIVRGQETGDIWLKILDQWSAKATQAS